jgi:hypothetical protein
MTDCDIPDSSLQAVADLAVSHLPTGSQAWVERGLAGLPHTLFVRAVGLGAEVVSFSFAAPQPEPLRSVTFYDRLTPVRWQLALLSNAIIAFRGDLAYLRSCEVSPAVVAAEAAHLEHLLALSGALQLARDTIRAAGPALETSPLYRNVISPETMRECGVSPMGTPPSGHA